MRMVKWLGGLALASSLVFAAPAAAQEQPAPFVATNVSFFEDVQLGDLVLSPVNIFYDTRCEDPELCFRNNQFSISVILFTDDGLEEVVLSLFDTTPVPGGTLTLTNTGTPPNRYGAIALEEYQLELEYRPTPRVEEPGFEPESAAEPQPSTGQNLKRLLPTIVEPARA